MLNKLQRTEKYIPWMVVFAAAMTSVLLISEFLS